MTAFILKIIASIFMLIDHVGAISPTPEIFRLIGRSVFPIYAYMIAQGCKHTRSINKYLLRLGVFAIISEIPFDLAFYRYFGNPFGVNYFRNTNVFYTLFLGAACIAVYEKLKTKRRPWLVLLLFLIIPVAMLTTFMFPDISWRIPLSIGFGVYTAVALWLSQSLPEAEVGAKTMLLRKVIALIITVPIFMLGSILSTDYGMYGVIFILVFYLAKPENRITRTIAMVSVVFFEYAYPYIYGLCQNSGINLFLPPGKMMAFSQNLNEFWFALVAVALVLLYNGKQGPKVKWFFYAFYPAHIATLAVILFINLNHLYFATEVVYMHGYIAIFSLILMISFVLFRSRQMKKIAIKAMRFAEIDKKDFLIPPFVLLYFYLIIANTFDLPRFGRVLDGGVVSSWVGAALCVLAPALFLWGMVSFGESFRVGIDKDKFGKLVSNGAFSVSRNPLYVAFFMILVGIFLIFPTWIFFTYLIAGFWLIDRQVCLEENSLKSIYGKEYDDYCGKVRRYI